MCILTFKQCYQSRVKIIMVTKCLLHVYNDKEIDTSYVWTQKWSVFIRLLFICMVDKEAIVFLLKRYPTIKTLIWGKDRRHGRLTQKSSYIWAILLIGQRQLVLLDVAKYYH